MPGSYRAGNFLAPGTGSFSVTGLAFQNSCQGVLFFGSNQSTEDAVVTNANAGVFCGLMALESEDVSSILGHASTVIPAVGQLSQNVPILMQSTYGVIEYAANAVSMDDDSFTVNFTVSPGGSRRIHWLAWGDFDQSACNEAYAVAHTITIGFRAKALLLAGNISSGGATGEWNRGDLTGGYYFAWWGAGSYPLTSQWEGAWLSASALPSSGQINMRMASIPGPVDTIPAIVTYGAGLIGPFLGETTHEAYPVGLTQLRQATPGFQNFDLMAYWDGDADTGSLTPDGVAAGEAIASFTNPHVDNPLAVLIFSASGQHGGGGSENTAIGLGFGIHTPDYQGCVLVNEGGNYLFQSTQRSWCSNVQPGGVSAGTITLGDNEMTFTTEDDDATEEELVWIVFGDPAQFIPQIYRWLAIPAG